MLWESSIVMSILFFTGKSLQKPFSQLFFMDFYHSVYIAFPFIMRFAKTKLCCETKRKQKYPTGYKI